MEPINSRHPLDVAQIFKEYGGQFLDRHRLCPDQLKAFRAISQCRSAAMGGHLQECSKCNHQRIAYNSCRNRHCNKCQYTKQLIWVDKLKSNLPACRYFHLVFTIPSALHKVFYLNQRVCYDLLFKASSQALRKVGENPKFLGAQTGAVAVLHTWGQALTYHPHIPYDRPCRWIVSRWDGVGPCKKEILPAGQSLIQSLSRGDLELVGKTSNLRRDQAA